MLNAEAFQLITGLWRKADNVYVMCTDIGWSDLGTWSSLYEHSAVDKKGNSLIRGDVFSYDNERNIFNISPGKIAVIQGLKDYIVVDSENVLLIVKKEEEQNIKQYLEDVKNSTKEEVLIEMDKNSRDGSQTRLYEI